MVVLAAGAFVPAAAQTKDTIRIAMVNFSLCCPYFIGMSQAVEEEAAFYPNIELIITDANGDAAKLTSDVEDVLAQNPDGIIISGAWLEAAPAALDAIQAAGVPVVLVDRLLKGGDYTSWIGPDNYTIGVQDGAYIVERLGGEGRLCVLRGGPADNSIGLDRSNGMLSEVEKSNIEVVEAPDAPAYNSWIPPIQETVATTGEGVPELAAEIARHVEHLRQSGDWAVRERSRLGSELEALLREALLARFREQVSASRYQEVLEQVLQRSLAPWEAVEILLNGWSK